MTGTHEQSPEVFVATDRVVRVTAADLASVRVRAVRSPRKCARLCAHSDSTDALHEMLICLAHGTYVRPHRHTGKSESFHIIEGELDVVLFEDDGAIREVIRMGPYSSGAVFFYRLAEPCFHTVLVRTPHVLFHETTNGPFDRSDTEFAEWSPAEGDRAAGEYVQQLQREDNRMSRKHSIIIGGTKGVGRELAGLFATAGHFVTAVGRSPGAFDSDLVEGFVGDAENPEALLASLAKQIEKRGKVSSLVFLQRYRGNGDSWAGELAVAMTATKTLLEGLVPHFAADGDRSICVVTSNASSFVARNQTLGYHTSKAALKQMARFYAVKFGPQGFRVNIVAPCTFVKSESAAYYGGQVALQAMYKQITPLARMGTAKEVAKAVAFLCGPDASFITGQELAVDGGLSLMLQDALAREVAAIA